jgi:ABC-2 type transport system ATP-binding protein
MIDTENLTRKFGNLTAVDNVTLHVDEGEVFGFLGPNGAGKTTTVRMLCCLIGKTSGNARIGDFAVDNEADCLKIRKMVGMLPENVGLYDSLSAYRNLDFYGKLYEVPEAKRRENISCGCWASGSAETTPSAHSRKAPNRKSLSPAP